MPWWGALLVGLGAALTVAEVGGLAKFLAQRLLNRTVARMPEHRRDIRAEELQAQFEQWDRASLLRAAWTAGLWLGAVRSSRRRPAVVRDSEGFDPADESTPVVTPIDTAQRDELREILRKVNARPPTADNSDLLPAGRPFSVRVPRAELAPRRSRYSRLKK